MLLLLCNFNHWLKSNQIKDFSFWIWLTGFWMGFFWIKIISFEEMIFFPGHSSIDWLTDFKLEKKIDFRKKRFGQKKKNYQIQIFRGKTFNISKWQFFSSATLVEQMINLWIRQQKKKKIQKKKRNFTENSTKMNYCKNVVIF